MAKFRPPFPKYIDKTRMIGPFEIDEAAFIVASVGFMLVLGFALAINVAIALIIGLFIGLAIAAAMKAVKKNFAEGYLYHLMYNKGVRHPLNDNPRALVTHPNYIKKKIKIMPAGYIKTLVE